MTLIPWRNKKEDTENSSHTLAPTAAQFRSQMDRLFDRFFHEPFGGLTSGWSNMGTWGPSLDMAETNTHVIVKAEVPGVDPKAVNITLTGNLLTISGEKSESKEQKGESYVHTERRFGSFQRSVQLPSYVDSEKISAEHANGVLTIQIAKVASAAPKRIEVKAG